MSAQRNAQRGARAFFLGILATGVLSGCGPIYPILGAWLGASATTGSGGEPAPEASAESALVRSTLPPDGTVPVAFLLRQPASLPASVVVDWAPADEATSDAAFRPATALASAPAEERGTESLRTSPSGVRHVYRWDAGADLGALAAQRGETVRAREVVVRIRPSRGTLAGSALTLPAFVAGNDPPALASASVDGEGDRFGNVVVRFAVRDTSSDPVDVELSFSTDGGETYQDAARATGANTGLGSTPETAGFGHDFVWDSVRDIGRRRVDGIRLRLRVRDRFSSFEDALAADQTQVDLAPLTIANNALPVVLLSEPALQADRTNEVPIRFRVQDAESNPVDVVIQWTAANDSFPPLDGQTGAEAVGVPGARTEGEISERDRFQPPARPDLRDARVRSAVLADPDARRTLRLITVVPVRISDRVGLDPTPSRVRLRALAELGAPPRQVGREVTFLDGACAGEVRQVVAYDPGGALATLDRALPATPDVGARVRIQRSDGLRGLASSPAGVEHSVVWDARQDLGPEDVDVRIRAVAFDAEEGAMSTSQPVRIENAPFGRGPSIANVAFFPAAGDLDLDGRDEIVVAGAAGTPARVFSFSDTGAFVEKASFPVDPTKEQWILPRVTLTPFGPALLLVSPTMNGATGRVRVVIGALPRPGGGPPQVIEIARPGLWRATLANLNPDPIPDLVLASVSSTPGGGEMVVIEVALGNPSPSGPTDLFGPPQVVATTTASTVVGLEVADLDGAMGPEIVAFLGPAWTGGPPFGGFAHELLVVRLGATGPPASAVTVLPSDISDNSFFQPSQLLVGAIGGRDPRAMVTDGFLLYELALPPGNGPPALSVVGRHELGGLVTSPTFSMTFVAGMALADLTGDGLRELVVRRVEGFDLGRLIGDVRVRVFGLDASGALVDRAVLTIGAGLSHHQGVGTGDFDGDGGTDIAAGGTLSSGALDVFFGRAALQTDDALLAAFPATRLTVGDRQGNGRTDIFSAQQVPDSGAPGRTTFLDQSAAGVLAPVGDATGFGPVLATDLLGGDGVPELLVGTEGVLDSGQRFLGTPEALLGGPLDPVVATGDWNGDGRPDVFGLAPTGDLVVRLQPRTASGTWAELIVVSTVSTSFPVPAVHRVESAVVRDLDGDGRDDVVAVLGDRTVRVAYSSGNGVAATAGPFAVLALPDVPPAIGDLNGDGRLDLAVAGSATPGIPEATAFAELHILLSNGPRGFAEAAGSPLPAAPLPQLPILVRMGLAVADVTGDGRADLVAHGPIKTFSTVVANQTTRLYAQRPDGTLRPPAPIATWRGSGGDLDRPLTIAVADTSGDGRPDLHVAPRGGGVRRFIARGQSPALTLAGRLEGAPPATIEVVSVLFGPAGPEEVDRRRVEPDGVFHARLPAGRVAELAAPPAAPAGAPPAPRPARRIAVPVVLLALPAGERVTVPLPTDALGLALVLEPGDLDARLVAGLTVSPLSTAAAVAGLQGAVDAASIRQGLALARSLLAGGALDPGRGPLVSTSSAAAVGLAADDPAVLQGLLLEAWEDVASAQATSSVALAHAVGLAMGATTTPSNPVAAALAGALRARDPAGRFVAVADGIEAGVAPAAPPSFTVSPAEVPAAGGAEVTLTATAGGVFPAGLVVRIGSAAGEVAVTGAPSSTVRLVAPASSPGAQVVTVSANGRGTEGGPLVYYTGDRQANVSPSSLAFAPVFVGTDTGSTATCTVSNAASASAPLHVLELRLVALQPALVRDPLPGDGAPPFVVPDASTLPPIAPGGSLALPIQFRPTGLRAPLSLLEVVTDDPDQPVRTVALDAVDAARSPLVVEDVCFGYTPSGSTATATLSVTNLSDTAIEVDILAPPPAGFSLSTGPHLSLGPGEVRPIAASFSPIQPGALEGSVTFVQAPAAITEVSETSTLGGVGTGARLVVLPDATGAPLDLGLVAPGSTEPPLALRLVNRGAGSPTDPTAGQITVTELSLVGAGFTLSSGGLGGASTALLTAPEVALPCGPGPKPGPKLGPKPGPGTGSGTPSTTATHDLTIIYDPPPLPGGAFLRLDTATLTIRTVELGEVEIPLLGRAVSGLLAAGGGPSATSSLSALARRLDADPGADLLQVEVRDAWTGEPVEGAAVRVSPAAAPGSAVVLSTGADGRASTSTDADAIDVHVGKSGYARQSYLGTASADLTILLAPREASEATVAVDLGAPGASCGDKKQVLSSYVGTLLRGTRADLAAFDAGVPGPTRVAGTALRYSVDPFTYRTVVCALSPSGFGPRVTAAPAGPLELPAGGLVDTVTSTLLVPASPELTVDYTARVEVAPSGSIDPWTGLVVGEGPQRSFGFFDPVELPVVLLDPASLAPLLGTRRLRVSLEATVVSGVRNPFTGEWITQAELQETRVRLPAGVASVSSSYSIALPVVSNLTDATLAGATLTLAFMDQLATSTSAGLFRVDLVDTEAGTVLWTVFLAPESAPAPSRTVELDLALLPDGLSLSSPTAGEVTLTGLLADLSDSEDPPLAATADDVRHLAGFAWHELHRRVVGRTAVRRRVFVNPTVPPPGK